MLKIILIIADFNENNHLIISMKQLPFDLFKSVAFSSGTPGRRIWTTLLFYHFSGSCCLWASFYGHIAHSCGESLFHFYLSVLTLSRLRDFIVIFRGHK